MLDLSVTKEEIVTALRDMKKDKVPGCDGLGNEFYLQFLDALLELLWENYQFVLQEAKFNNSAKKGLMSLIPKPNKTPHRNS